MELPSDDGRRIAEEIRAGNARCISDGSLKNLFGTSAFKFMLNNDSAYLGRNRVPGMDRDQNSYRSELCGMLGNVIVINAICRAFCITEPFDITMACDNESAIWKTFFAEDEPIQSDCSCDILFALRRQLQISPLTWKGKWVKGHQDDDTEATLDEWAIDNIEVDRAAGAYWTQMVQDMVPVDQGYWDKMGNRSILRPAIQKMPGENWQMRINGHKIVGAIDDLLYDHCHRVETVHYWESKGRIMEQHADDIDWESHKKAMTTFGARKHWVTKHFLGWAGSGVNMQKWGYRTINKCPRCDEPESTLHVIQCRAADNDQVYWGAVAPLGDWLVKKAHPDVQQAIMEHMNAYRERRTAVVKEDWSEEVKEASREQSRLGYRSLAEGLPVTRWRCIAQTRATKGDVVEKGLRWTSALIRKCWEVSWDMWVERNDIVHNDGEVRDVLVIQAINAQVRTLQHDGSRCRDLCTDDRRFFKTPFWKIKKKTEQQKIRYIETAKRLLDDSRKSGQQTLRQWRLGTVEEESSADESDETDQRTGVQRGVGRRLYRQTSLRAHFGGVQNNSTESIDGASATSSTSIAEQEGPMRGRDISHTTTQPSAGGDRPSADRVQPSAGQGRPSADRDAGASQPHQY